MKITISDIHNLTNIFMAIQLHVKTLGTALCCHEHSLCSSLKSRSQMTNCLYDNLDGNNPLMQFSIPIFGQNLSHLCACILVVECRIESCWVWWWKQLTLWEFIESPFLMYWRKESVGEVLSGWGIEHTCHLIILMPHGQLCSTYYVQ